jgi:hypothetical protein
VTGALGVMKTFSILDTHRTLNILKSVAQPYNSSTKKGYIVVSKISRKHLTLLIESSYGKCSAYVE